MKKSIALIALAFAVTSASAQDLTSKKGEPILPEAGDWGIGIDATPFLGYMGNFFGKSESNSAPTFGFLNTTQVITGRYFVNAQTVFRGSLRIGFGGNTQRAEVLDRSAISTPSTYPNPQATVENSWKTSNTNIGLSFGIEKRKGKTRLQGYYGAEAGIYLSAQKDKFTYGNALNPVAGVNTNSVGVTTDDIFPGANNVITNGSGVPLSTGTSADGARATERKSGTTFSFGLRGFVGVEYFILPKMSLGGEFGWGIGLSATGKGTTTYESVGNTGSGNDVVGTTKITDTGKQGSFAVDTDNKNTVFGASGSIRFNFYF